MSEMTNSEFKLLGFIRQKDKNHFVVRVKTQLGNVNSEQLAALSDVARKYGRGYLTFTNRLNIDIPWIMQENLDAARQALEEAGLKVGGTGPTVRPIVACKGTICHNGLVDTQGLGEMLDMRFFGRKLPAKFKIGIAGCQNDCAKAEINDVGFVGQRSSKTRGESGYAAYFGGTFGRDHREGRRAGELLSSDEAVALTERVIEYMERNARPKERLGMLIDRVGWDVFLDAIGLTP
ncbi:Assimilatory ferredoxin-dependent nitrite reductase [uncultured archaeon]|nr:Assimilatory ferredoxin-dependent nitrite reductase [uncultured archaeon]